MRSQTRIAARLAGLVLLLGMLLPLLPAPASAVGPYSLLVSTSSNRSAPQLLAGRTVSGNIYVFTSPDTSDIDEVRFYLDDPQTNGNPRRTEGNGPYDFAGGTVSTASPFNTQTLSNGSHTITAEVDLTAGATEVVNATFTVSNGAGLVFTPGSLSLSATAGGDTVSDTVQLAADTGAAASFSVSDNASWLSVAPTSGATPASVTITANPSGLSAGTHQATVTASAAGFAPDTLPVTLTVEGGGGGGVVDQVHLAWVGDPSTTMTVVWRTLDTSVASQVQYRALGAPSWLTASGAERAAGTTGKLHEVLLSGLTPSTEYEYRVRAPGATWSSPFTTRTAPPAGPADFDAIYLADTGLVGRADGLATGTQQVVDEIVALDPLLVLPGGDYIYYNSDKRYGSLDNSIDAWFNQMQPIASRAPLMPVYGNHEVLLGEGYDAWAARFPTPTGFDGRRNYSFDIGDVHFVAIFVVENNALLPSATLDWIEQDILDAQASGQRWIIPYFHVSPFSEGTNHPSNLNVRAQLGPLFEQLGVQLVIASHDQSYERTYPLTDVPGTNTPTTAGLDCYTPSDGTTWIKVSPAGKLSNISGGFSPWATPNAPLWTAVRDNSMHHFARLVVSASGVLRVEIYGLTGDGSPPVIQDAFEYRSNGCPPAITSNPTTLALSANQGGAPVTDLLSIDTTGDVANLTVSDDASWLSVSPSSGTSPATLTVNANPAGLAIGTYRATVTISVSGFDEAAVAVQLRVSPPGRIEAEDYRLGGEGVGYHDTSDGNTGGKYRSDDVDIGECDDATTPAGLTRHYVGWTAGGEWLTYDLNLASGGNHAFKVRYATPNSGKSVKLEVDGVQVGANLSLPSTGGWQAWSEVTSATIALSPGSHTLKLTINSSGVNLNYLTVVPPSDPTPPAAPTGLSATGSATGIALNWNDNGEIDLDGYHVYRAPAAAGPFTKLTTAGPVPASAYTDSTAPPGSTSWYHVTAVDDSGNESAPSATASADRPPAAGIPLPGTIQAEDYHAGGEGVGYHDTTSGNNGGQYRTDNVDIQQCSDPRTPGGQTCYNVGWTTAGEWLQYTVDVQPAGSYRFTLRVATPNSGKTVRIEVDGVNVTGTLTVPNTGGYQNWVNLTSAPVTLSAGSHTVRVVFITGGINLNYVTVAPS